MMVVVPFMLFVLLMLPSLATSPIRVRIGRIVARARHVSRGILRVISRISVAG